MTVKISDVYRPAVVTCASSDSLRTASRRMVEADTGVLVLMDGDLLAVEVLAAPSAEGAPGAAGDRQA